MTDIMWEVHCVFHQQMACIGSNQLTTTCSVFLHICMWASNLICSHIHIHTISCFIFCCLIHIKKYTSVNCRIRYTHRQYIESGLPKQEEDVHIERGLRVVGASCGWHCQATCVSKREWKIIVFELILGRTNMHMFNTYWDNCTSDSHFKSWQAWKLGCMY